MYPTHSPTHYLPCPLYLAPCYISTSHTIENARYSDSCDKGTDFFLSSCLCTHIHTQYIQIYIRLCCFIIFLPLPPFSSFSSLWPLFSQAVKIPGPWPVPPLAPFLLFSSLILSKLGRPHCFFFPVSQSLVWLSFLIFSVHHSSTCVC